MLTYLVIDSALIWCERSNCALNRAANVNEAYICRFVALEHFEFALRTKSRGTIRTNIPNVSSQTSFA